VNVHRGATAKLGLVVSLDEHDRVNVTMDSTPRLLSPDTLRMLLSAGTLALSQKLVTAVGLGPPEDISGEQVVIGSD